VATNVLRGSHLLFILLERPLYRTTRPDHIHYHPLSFLITGYQNYIVHRPLIFQAIAVPIITHQNRYITVYRSLYKFSNM